MRKTGQICCCECILVGQISMASKQMCYPALQVTSTTTTLFWLYNLLSICSDHIRPAQVMSPEFVTPCDDATTPLYDIIMCHMTPFNINIVLYVKLYDTMICGVIIYDS